MIALGGGAAYLVVLALGTVHRRNQLTAWRCAVATCSDLAAWVARSACSAAWHGPARSALHAKYSDAAPVLPASTSIARGVSARRTDGRRLCGEIRAPGLPRRRKSRRLAHPAAVGAAIHRRARVRSVGDRNHARSGRWPERSRHGPTAERCPVRSCAPPWATASRSPCAIAPPMLRTASISTVPTTSRKMDSDASPEAADQSYEFEAGPAGLHPVSLPRPALRAARAQGHVRRHDRRSAASRGRRRMRFVLCLCGFDVDGDGRNDVYAWNGVAGYYERFPLKVPAGELVRIYLMNMVEPDPIASFHLHAQTFDLYRSGTSALPSRAHRHREPRTRRTGHSRISAAAPRPLYVSSASEPHGREGCDGLDRRHMMSTARALVLAAIADAAQPFGVPWQRRSRSSNLIDHGMLIYLATPDGRFVQALHPQQPVSELVGQIQAHLDRRGAG